MSFILCYDILSKVFIPMVTKKVFSQDLIFYPGCEIKFELLINKIVKGIVKMKGLMQSDFNIHFFNFRI